MKQALIKKGRVYPAEVPQPQVSPGSVLIKVMHSCISSGTELTSVANTQKSLIKRALEQPEQVKQALNFLREQGLQKTLARIKGQLEAERATGYSISGQIIAVGEGIDRYQVGDRVAAAGAGLANHAEYVDVPENLVMKMPNNLDFKSASTVTLGGIALQGVRRCEVKLGEYAVIIGGGVLGLLALQMFKLAGVKTVLTDLDPKRLELAQALGADLVIQPQSADAVKDVLNFTGQHGADAVLFAAATSASEPLSQAFKMCRKKGRVVLMGVSGMEIKREDIYAKELDFLISTSYGPGRYDRIYEEKGIDYPYAYVRWTENRNMTTYLEWLQEGKIMVEPLIHGVYKIDQVEEAFISLQSSAKPILVILDYTNHPPAQATLTKEALPQAPLAKKPPFKIALVGAGSFATGMHLPNLIKLKDKFILHTVMSRTGVQAKNVGTQWGFSKVTAHFNDVITDPEVDVVLICTRHDSHAQLALQALQAGKHVFLEKPLATTPQDLQLLHTFFNSPGEKPFLMVGFNRRFSPYAREIKKLAEQRINPLLIHYRMNAGYIPLDTWYHEHGGRMVGEACHIIDLFRFLVGHPVISVQVESLSPRNDKYSPEDNKMVLLKYSDGSVATLHYFATGSKELMKEYMDVHFDGKSITMEDYKVLHGYEVKVNSLTSKFANKGQFEEWSYFFEALTKPMTWPISWEEMLETTEITFLL